MTKVVTICEEIVQKERLLRYFQIIWISSNSFKNLRISLVNTLKSLWRLREAQRWILSSKMGREKKYTRDYRTVRLLFSPLNNNVKHLREVYILIKSEFHLVPGVWNPIYFCRKLRPYFLKSNSNICLQL